MTQITVSIPSEYVVLTRDEFKKLEEAADDRVWIDFKTLQDLTGIKRTKLDEILTRYREELDVEHDGPVKYADGGRWNFNKKPLLKWLQENYQRIWMDDPYYGK